MSKSLKEIAQVAAEWWADRVANPKFDNGDKGYTGFMLTALSSMLVKPVSSESRDKFIEFLTNSIVDQLVDRVSAYGVPNITLDVDYGACGTLRRAGEYAGIADTNFPIKTIMWIDKNHVSVRYGYGAKEEYLYANKAYWENSIASIKVGIEDYRSGRALSWMKDARERSLRAKEQISYFEKELAEYKSNLEKAEE